MLKIEFSEKHTNEIIDKYNSGISTEKICLDYEVSPLIIVKLLKNNNVKIRGKKKLIDEQKLIKDYRSGLKNKEIREKYKVSDTKIFSILTKNKVERKGTKKYNVDENFFENIDTEEKAYWLGFLYADGYVRNIKNNRSAELRLKLSYKDIEHIKLFKRNINSEHKINIKTQKMKINDKTYYSKLASISIYSSKMVQDLINNGCVNNKSKIVIFPYLKSNLIRHFIRGVFDGDGSVSITKYKGYDNNNFNIVSGSYAFIEKIKEILLNLNIYNCIITENKSNCWYINWYRKEDIRKIYHYLYDNSSIYLNRKKEKFEDII